MNPWIGPPTLTQSGIPIGIHMNTGAIIMYDPWKMKLEGLINSLIFLVLGLKDYGKSTFLKVLMMRLLMLQSVLNEQTGEPEIMRGRLHGRKREGDEDEMAPTTNFLRGKLLKLRDMPEINQFDPRMGLNEWDVLETVINDAEYSRGSGLVHYQPLAFQVAVHKLLKLSREQICLETIEWLTRNLQLSDVDAYYQDVDGTTSRMLNDNVVGERPDILQQMQFTAERPHSINEAEFLQDASLAASDLNRIIAGRGDFGNTFGGLRSIREYLEDPMTTFDWNGVNPRARGLLEATLQKWQATAADRNDKAVIPHVNGADEASDAFQSVQWARFRLQNVVKSRAFPTCDVELAQNEMQISHAGSEGSELRELGHQISLGVAARFYFRQNSDEALLSHIGHINGMSEQTLTGLTNLPKYCALMCVPHRPPVPMQVFITTTEARNVDTNSATRSMDQRVPVTSLDSYQRRVEAMRSKGLVDADDDLLILTGEQLRERARTHGVVDFDKLEA